MRKESLLKVEKTLSLKGKVKASPSKSYTIRAITCAALSGRVKIINPLISEDTRAAIGAFRRLGALIEKRGNALKVKGFGARPSLVGEVNVGESGTLLRLILPIIALGKGRFLVQGEGTLLKRPHKAIAEVLLSLGACVRGKDSEFRLPLRIDGRGELSGGKVKVSGQMSSQAISSLLTVAPLAVHNVELVVKDKVVSAPYIDITLNVLKRFGIKVKRQGYKRFFISAPQSYEPKEDFVIHGDYSSAAFLITAGCLVESDITITDLVSDSQGDRNIIQILNSMGAKIIHTNGCVRIRGPFNLRGRDIDCSNTPDLVPILAAAGCFAKGTTRIRNIRHLAYKESNRIQAPAGELKKLGANIRVGADSLIIEESVLRPAVVSGCNDHRIAMALAVCGLRIGGIAIKGIDCVNKSYPRFIPDMKSLGARFIIKN
jgi:3-phosphoshikimate 1-carboxyvinyltransferase